MTLFPHAADDLGDVHHRNSAVVRSAGVDRSWFMMVADRMLGTTFFIPGGIVVNDGDPTVGGGQTLLWQHLFWFYSHPAVYIMLLPAMGMVSDMLACMSRKPIFGYKPMVYSMAAIAGLGFIVWGAPHVHLGNEPRLGNDVHGFDRDDRPPLCGEGVQLIGTMWGGRLVFNTVMLNSVAFVSMFIVGGLSGIFMAAVPVDIYIHDTYFIVGPLPLCAVRSDSVRLLRSDPVLVPEDVRPDDERAAGQAALLPDLIGFNGTFFPMHLLGVSGMPRRYADPYLHPYLEHLLPMNQFMTILRS